MRLNPTLYVLILSALAGHVLLADPPIPTVNAIDEDSAAKNSATLSKEIASKEVQTLRRQLLSPKRSGETRYDAARMLLDRNSADAQRALLDALGPAAPAESQIAASRALTNCNGAIKPYLPALRQLMRSTQPGVSQRAATALASSSSREVGIELRKHANDATLALDTRTVIIAALSRRVDKQTIETLVELLRDRQPGIRNTAAESLQRLTALRTHGQSYAKWSQWWKTVRAQTPAEFQRTMIDNLLRAQDDLRSNNAALLAQLLQAHKELFTASPAASRPALVAELLDDPIEDIRLLGAQLCEALIAADVTLPFHLTRRVHNLLHDPSAKLRSTAPRLEAALNDKRATSRLLAALKRETHPAVRIALLEALGKIASPSTLKVVLAEVSSPMPAQAKAAASALRRILRAAPPKAPKPIAEILNARYDQSDDADAETPALREALLEALAATALPSASDRMTQSLKDPAGVVRLAALNGLRQLQTKTAAKAIAPLVADSDRGVRLAAVGALAQLAGMDYFKTIFQRTKPAVEEDAEVRKAARDALMGLFREADATTLTEGIKLLDTDRETLPLRIELLRLYVKRQRTAKAESLPADLRRLGMALGESGEHAQSAATLLEGYKLLQATAKTADQQFTLQALWGDCATAALNASDPAYAKLLAAPPDESLFDSGYAILTARLDALRKDQHYLPIVALSDVALSQLAKQLSPSRTRQLQSLRQWAKTKQAALDAQQIKTLLPDLLSADLDTRDEAIKAVMPLGRRAIAPLLDQIEAKLKQTPPAPRDEGTLFDLLRQIEPAVGDYDPAATPETKTELLKSLRKQFVK